MQLCNKILHYRVRITTFVTSMNSLFLSSDKPTLEITFACSSTLLCEIYSSRKVHNFSEVCAKIHVKLEASKSNCPEATVMKVSMKENEAGVLLEETPAK